MKEIQDKIRDSLIIMFLGIHMYIFSFLIIPFSGVIFGIWIGDGLAMIFSLIAIIIITVVGLKKVRDWKIIFYWLMGDLLCCCLIAVYHLPGLYGIGERGAGEKGSLLFSTINTYETDMFELMASLGGVFIIQVMVGMVVGLSRLIKKWKASCKQDKLQKADKKDGNLFDNPQMTDTKSNSFLIKCVLSVGITLLLFATAFLMQYFFGIVLDFLREIGLLLLEVISIIAIWSKKHRKGYNTYLYIFGTVLVEIVLLIILWSRHIGESELKYLLGGYSEFDSIGTITEIVPAFAGAVIILVLIRLAIGLCHLVKSLIKKCKSRKE